MNKKKIIITTIIIAVIFTGIVMGKNCLSYKIPNTAMGVRSVVARGRIDTLFIGSSGYRKGIDMERIITELPGESFMLTYNGNEPFNVLIELEEILRENVSIGTLIVDFNPSMADRGADLSDKRLLWDISMNGKIKLWRELAKEDTSNLFTFYDYWVLSNNDYMITYPVSYPLIAARYSYGGSTTADETKGLSKDELEALPIIEHKGVHELQRNSILSIIELCENNDINLVFMESPRYITMESNENYRTKSQELRDLIIDNGALCILREDLSFDNTNPDYYSDLTHMSGEGKEEFTKAIINTLNSKIELSFCQLNKEK